MNKILEKEENIVINKDTILYLDDSNINVSIDINSCAKVKVFHYVFDKSVNISINLNACGADIEYFYSTINYQDNKLSVDVNHNFKNTISNIYNHGVNVCDNRLDFLVNGIVKNGISSSICNQENQIINIMDGKSTICPNLLIDCYDISSSHSAYIGKFNMDKIFYLESRGFTKKRAYKLLINGFLIPTFVEKDRIVNYLQRLEKI